MHSREAAPPEIRLEVNTPSTTDPLSFAISPDGRRLVFSVSNEGKSQLWVRPLDSVAAQPLAGTDGASYPFWSPDSASVGFFADSKLKRIDIVGGAPQVLANAAAGGGGAWNREGTILFAPTLVAPLFKVAATGGEPVAVTRLDPGQAGHWFPQFLPDGQHFIYFVYGFPSQGGNYRAALEPINCCLNRIRLKRQPIGLPMDAFCRSAATIRRRDLTYGLCRPSAIKSLSLS